MVVFSCGSHFRAGLIISILLKMRVSFKGRPLSRVGLFQGFTVLSIFKFFSGSSGAMYSLLFESAAVLIEGSSEVNATIAGKAFKAGLDAVMKYGRAQPGDRTMVDALSPAVASFISTLSSSGSSLKALEEATCAAEEGAKATLAMKASAGRASYVAASELRHPDPGAHAIGIIMRAVFEGYKIKANEMGL